MKALFLNFLVALSVIMGGIIGYIASSHVEGIANFLIPLAAGGFIYIAASDIIPEIREEKEVKKSLSIFCIFLLGVLIMWIGRMFG